MLTDCNNGAEMPLGKLKRHAAGCPETRANPPVLSSLSTAVAEQSGAVGHITARWRHNLGHSWSAR